MSPTRNAAGAPKPRGMWMPQLRKPEYYALRDLTQVLQAGQWRCLPCCCAWGRDCGRSPPCTSNSQRT
jgi:hypothetical protein